MVGVKTESGDCPHWINASDNNSVTMILNTGLPDRISVQIIILRRQKYRQR
jgi:hypothetical protein